MDTTPGRTTRGGTGTHMPAATATSGSRAPSPAQTGTPPNPSSAARPPSASQVGDDVTQVPGAGLLSAAVAAQLPDRIPSLPDSRATAAAGAAVTSSGTNPSHGSVHNCTAAPSTLPGR